jgi:hypothetical protein
MYVRQSQCITGQMFQSETAFGKQIGVEQRMSCLGRQPTERSVPPVSITVVQRISQP